MPDMNDPLLKRIAKGATVSVPKLPDTVLTTSISQPRPQSNLRLVFASTSIAAALVIGLVGVNVFGNPAITHLDAPLFSMARVDTMPSYGSAMQTWPEPEYLPGPAITNVEGTGKIYQLRRTGNPSEIVQKLAELFNLEGNIDTNYYSDDSNYVFTNGKVSGEPSIFLSWRGTGTWVVDFYEQGRLNESHAFLTDDKLKAKALEVFSKTGLNTQAEDLEIYKDSGRRVIGTLKVDGQKTSLQWEIKWDQRGNLQSVRGHSVEVVERGTFETISEQAAVKRIGDNRYAGMVYNPWSGRDWNAIMKDKSDRSTITIDRAAHTLMMVWDMKGNAWLTPGYVFQNNETPYWPMVMSVKDGVIELPKKTPMTY
jgi:hypothetical protein